ncbi:hypothetical protein FPZ54_07420 [Sphingomonas suaedae]|uniref:Anti-sigma factor NepR domain-containing protein n=1 Tax=Sphingomonas suaedae TaxID=2599297 RepID=A0A518REL4_9SPHN|nr:NepR family anti-sigma factor [Sphingomonas suaedae]QDX25868.1 hypothetical protein FPZ54_07420 [Sphingomonas suaedae]
MFSADDKNKSPQRRGGDEPARKISTPKDGRNVGDALRRVYQDAASEDVPDDLLDLLRKLD